MLKVKAEGRTTAIRRATSASRRSSKPSSSRSSRSSCAVPSRKGFRIPSFSESFALPTTGFVSRVDRLRTSAQRSYGAFCAAHASNPAYYAGTYNYGLTSSGNPNLKPEKSHVVHRRYRAHADPRRHAHGRFLADEDQERDHPARRLPRRSSTNTTHNNGVVNCAGHHRDAGVSPIRKTSTRCRCSARSPVRIKNADQFLAARHRFLGVSREFRSHQRHQVARRTPMPRCCCVLSRPTTMGRSAAMTIRSAPATSRPVRVRRSGARLAEHAGLQRPGQRQPYRLLHQRLLVGSDGLGRRLR